jgi:hypothetical protein
VAQAGEEINKARIPVQIGKQERRFMSVILGTGFANFKSPTMRLSSRIEEFS